MYSIIVVTSAEEGCYVFTSVCLSVCLSVRRITEKVVNGFWRNFFEGRAWPRAWVVKFWWRSGSPSGSRSPKSKIRIHWIMKKYLVDSDQSCIANLHCKNHSAILLCWRLAEVFALSTSSFFSEIAAEMNIFSSSALLCSALLILSRSLVLS